MDFTFTPDEEQFRHELRAFLDAQLPAAWSERDFIGEVSPQERLERAGRMTTALADRGWLALGWSREAGGAGAGYVSQMIFSEETAYRRMPGGGGAGVQWVGPAIQRFGTAAQRAEYLPRVVSGQDRWCLMYTESEAGSDVANLQTRAVRDGDEYVISGAKTWVVDAQQANMGLLAARTDPEAPPTEGISTLIVPMDAAGVTVRPLLTIAGEQDLNEVILDEVRVPVSALVGQEHAGWYQMNAVPEFERSGVEVFAAAKANVERLVSAARDDASLVSRNLSSRYEIADRWIEVQVGYNVAYRVPRLQAQGEDADREATMSKLYGSELTQRVAGTGMHLLGLTAQIAPDTRYAKLAGAFQQEYLKATTSTVVGGTAEIQRNLIAQRGLGLPKER